MTENTTTTDSGSWALGPERFEVGEIFTMRDDFAARLAAASGSPRAIAEFRPAAEELMVDGIVNLSVLRDDMQRRAAVPVPPRGTASIVVHDPDEICTEAGCDRGADHRHGRECGVHCSVCRGALA